MRKVANATCILCACLLSLSWAQSPKDRVDDWTTGRFLTYPPGAKVILLDSSKNGSELGFSNREISVPAGGKDAIFYYRLDHPDGRHQPVNIDLPSGYFNAKQHLWPESGREFSLPGSLWVHFLDLFRYPSWRTAGFGFGLVGLLLVSWAGYQAWLTRALKSLGGTLGVSPYLGYYRLQSLKSGGNGEIFTVVPRRKIRPEAVRALKIVNLRGEAKDRRENQLRDFPREVEVIRTMKHPNIPVFYESGHLHNDRLDELYLVMEFIDGSDLSHYVPANPKNTNPSVLYYLKEIATALQAMHDKGLIHRDLKPENVMLSKDGRIVLLDFGLSRPQNKTSEISRMDGFFKGTPGYFCPEQFRGIHDEDNKMTVLSDQYAFGVMCSRLIAGHFPIPIPESENTTPYVMDVIQGNMQFLAEVRPDLANTSQVITKMMSLRSTDRYPTISEAYQALEQAWAADSQRVQ